jgi:hypothetical protein
MSHPGFVIGMVMLSLIAIGVIIVGAAMSRENLRRYKANVAAVSSGGRKTKSDAGST